MNQLNWYNRKIIIPTPRYRGRNLSNIRGTLFTTILVLYSSVSFSQQSIYDIIKLDSCQEITLTEEPELYVGDDLFSLINGGAELYHEYGFVEVLACSFETQAGNEVKCEVYDMGSPEAAWGIYSVTETSNAQPFHAGTAGRSGEGFSQFIKDRYMFYMYQQPEDSHDIEYLAGCLASNIPEYHPEPLLMKKVVSTRKDATKTIYFRGNLGLSTVYSFHYKDVFNFVEGAAAVYPDLTIILLDYEDEVQCLENYNSARDFFMNSSKYHDHISLRGSFHMKDRKEQQIDCYLENDFLIIFISSGEHDLIHLREEIVTGMNNPVTVDR